MNKKEKRQLEDDRFLATIDMIKRTGASSFQIRYSDDEIPTVWFAVAGYEENHWESAGAMDPLTAAFRLLETLVDGGCCSHCGQPTGVTEDWEGRMPMGGLICWYRYDPELKKFRRSCEGDHAKKAK